MNVSGWLYFEWLTDRLPFFISMRDLKHVVTKKSWIIPGIPDRQKERYGGPADVPGQDQWSNNVGVPRSRTQV
jgi:hypothetical protein